MKAVHSRDYYHEQDKQALDTLRAIPGFTAALKSFMKVFNENMLHGVNMSSKIRLGPKQLPKVYAYLPPICEALGIDEPEFYLEMNPAPNAYTFGDSQPAVTISSALLEYMEEDEVRAVIAHECGHIACHHVLYHTMASLLLQSGSELLGLGVLTAPLKLALFYWERCAEFSCDRAAAICRRGSAPVVETMTRLAGGSAVLTKDISTESFLEQAELYSLHTGESLWNKTLQAIALMNRSHPFLAVRALEIKKWCEGDAFKRILAFSDGVVGDVCPSCGGKWENEWKFCRRCGYKK